MMLEDRLHQRQMEKLGLQRQTALDARQAKLDEAGLRSRSIEDALHQAQIGATQAKAAQSGQPKVKTLPATAVEKMVGVDNMLSNAGDVQHSLEDAIASKTNATGRVFGVIKTPTWAKNTFGMGGEKGLHVRNVIGSLKGTIAKERAGTSMTPSELDLLESYIPSDNDPEEIALAKAKDFVRALNQIKANRAAAYGKYGYSMGAEVPEGADEEQLPFGSYEP